MKKLLLIGMCLLATCKTVEIKPDKQIDENKKNLALIEDARNLVKELEIKPKSKHKLYETLAKSEINIVRSTEVLKKCKEQITQITGKLMNAETKIRKQAKYLWWFIIENIIILAIIVIYILYRINPAMVGANRIKEEIQNLKNLIGKK